MDIQQLSAVHIHSTHTLQKSFLDECSRCWGCSCHSPDVLAKPCEYTVDLEVRQPGSADAASKQAFRYGEQIRLLEDAGLEEDRLRVGKAWAVFLNLLKNTSLLSIARDSYKEAYMGNKTRG